MMSDSNPLSGIVEVDETYIGGKSDSAGRFKDKTAVIGMAEKAKGSSRVDELVFMNGKFKYLCLNCGKQKSFRNDPVNWIGG
jgi:hypothetical protein